MDKFLQQRTYLDILTCFLFWWTGASVAFSFRVELNGLADQCVIYVMFGGK